jgi:hypothetical protein
MKKTKRYDNTRQGGHSVKQVAYQILADPNGNREQRRAAKKLKVSNESC